MYLIYNILVLFLIVFCLPIILVALILTPKFRAGFFQKIGFYKNIDKNGQKHIVVHAVSVGEVIAVEKFVKTLREEFPAEKIILTTVTKTGNAVANQKLKATVDEIIYFPFDFCFAVDSFVKNIKPDMTIIAETEIWPYFSRAMKKNNIPILIINGRISPNSHKGYKRFSWFFKQILANYTKILTQTQGDMERMIDIGANSEITQTMGNLKFDIAKNLSEQEIIAYKEEFKINDNPVFIVGSTHKGEDEIVCSVYKKLLNKLPNLKMILAPRHPERLKDVENLLKANEFSFGKRSQKDNFEQNQIILIDTMGELSKLYAVADVAYIGGSFSNTGGHNPLEASIYDVPVVSGPSTFNFKDIYKFLTAFEAAFVVDTEEALHEKTEKLFLDREFYLKTSKACNKIFEENSGAISFALNIIKEIL